MNQPVVIRFFADVNAQSVNALLASVDQQLAGGATAFHVLISTMGGSVFHGLTAYNYLRGIPAEVTTHNIGSVDSIGVTMYCAGSNRRSVPNARFLLHEVALGLNGNFDDRSLENHLKNLRIDAGNVAGVVAANTGKSVDDVKKAMLEHTTLNPQDAKEWGLVHEIEADLYEQGSHVVVIQ